MISAVGTPALDESGRPSFNTLQNYGSSRPPVLYYAFDVLVLAGRSLLKETLDTRREFLEQKILPKLREPLRYSPTLEGPSHPPVSLQRIANTHTREAVSSVLADFEKCQKMSGFGSRLDGLARVWVFAMRRKERSGHGCLRRAGQRDGGDAYGARRPAEAEIRGASESFAYFIPTHAEAAGNFST
jgi:hypothetical protein